MKRKAIIIVLDGVGIGALPDAERYGDLGANTLAHVAERAGLRLPNLSALGLGNIPGSGLPSVERPLGGYGRMKERAQGKDTTSGHWEIAGLTLQKAFPVFPEGFPQAFIEALEAAISRKTLGNYASSGTVILEQLGEEHLKTGSPIVYTSADSVFQIAAHEEVVPPDALYAICRTARALLTGDLAVGRVIARPFVGRPGSFVRTGNRRDFSLEPMGDTLLDVLKRAEYAVLGVGKIEDIFAHRGLTDSDHASGNEACVDALLRYQSRPEEGLIFVNLVDYDALYGHRRDAQGFARALEAFDGRLPEILQAMGEEDLLVITADHGCDPTHAGTDHTREYVPVLLYRKAPPMAGDLGTRESFSDVAATVLAFFGLPNALGGESMIGSSTTAKGD